MVVHHGGNTVAHSCFVAPVGESRKECGCRRQSGWFVAHAAVHTLGARCGNDQAPLGAHGLHPSGQQPFPNPKADGVP